MQNKDKLLVLLELKLEDGTPLSVRPITLKDVELEKDFFNGLSQQSKHDRFLGAISELSQKELIGLCDLDYHNDMAYIAISKEGGSEKIVGVTRYAVDFEGSNKAEIAVAIADDWLNKGIGTHLLTRLIEFAKLSGINKLYSIDSSSNLKMKELANSFGFTKTTNPDEASQVIYNINITK